MQKMRYILGLPVLQIETGTQIGEVFEIMVDIERIMIYGIVIDGGDLSASKRIILFDDLSNVGRDAIMVHNDLAIRRLDSGSLMSNIYYLRDLFDKQIFTESGLRLGILADIMFDNRTGEMKGYQVSDSIITDLLYGRMVMPVPQVQVIGQEKMIVPEAMAKLLQAEEDVYSIQ